MRFFQSQQIEGTRAEIRDACAPHGYHPLALRLLAGLIVKDHRKPRDISVASRHPISKEMVLRAAYNALDQPKKTC